MTLILDAGAFLALERGDRETEYVLRRESSRGHPWVTHGGVVGQVWRGGARQARLARALRATRVVPLSVGLGREAGQLLASAGSADVVDAALVCLAEDGDLIVTSDPGDLVSLVAASGIDVAVLAV